MKRLRHGRKAPALGITAALALGLAIAPAASAYTSQAVDGRTVSGQVLLRATSSGPVAEVRFTLTGPVRRTVVDRSAPFIFNPGTGTRWDTTTVPDGSYTLTGLLVGRRGQRARIVDNFLVRNLGSRAGAPAPAPSSSQPGLTTGSGSGHVTVTGAMSGTETVDTRCTDLGEGIYSVRMTGDDPAFNIVLTNAAGASALDGTISPRATSIADGSRVRARTYARGRADFTASIVDTAGRSYGMTGDFNCG